MTRFFTSALFFLCFFTSTAFGQFSRTGLELSVKGGGNYHTYYGSQADLSKGKFGFLGGLGMTLRFANRFGIGVEALYVQKGGQGSVTNPETHQQFTWQEKAGYLDVPVTIQFMGGNIDHTRHKFYLGGGISKLLTTSYEGDGFNGTDKGGLRDLDAIVVCGGGWSFVFDWGLLDFDVRATLGLRGVYNDVTNRVYDPNNPNRNTYEMQMNNASVQLTIGYTLPIDMGR